MISRTDRRLLRKQPHSAFQFPWQRATTHRIRTGSSTAASSPTPHGPPTLCRICHSADFLAFHLHFLTKTVVLLAYQTQIHLRKSRGARETHL